MSTFPFFSNFSPQLGDQSVANDLVGQAHGSTSYDPNLPHQIGDLLLRHGHDPQFIKTLLPYFRHVAQGASQNGLPTQAHTMVESSPNVYGASQGWHSPQPSITESPTGTSSSGNSMLPQVKPDQGTQSLWRQHMDALHAANDILSQVEQDRPTPQSIYPRPGLAGVVALLSGLANNQFRSDDDPYNAFMNSYAAAKNEQNQNASSEADKRAAVAKIKADRLLGDADAYMSQYQNARDDELRQQQKDDQARADQKQEDTDYSDARNFVLRNLPEYQRPYGPNIARGISNAQKFLDATDEEEQRWKDSDLQGPTMFQWQESPDGKSLSLVQQQLGEAIFRSEMLHHMIDQFPANLSPGQNRALKELEDQLRRNQTIVDRLFRKNPKSPSEAEKAKILDRADSAIRAHADERAVHNRARGLLLGLQHPDSKDGYFDFLMPSYGRTQNGIRYSVAPQ